MFKLTVRPGEAEVADRELVEMESVQLSAMFPSRIGATPGAELMALGSDARPSGSDYR
jgi:hypothetical protein